MYYIKKEKILHINISMWNIIFHLTHIVQCTFAPIMCHQDAVRLMLLQK